MPGLSGLVALARGFRLPVVRLSAGLAISGPALALRRLCRRVSATAGTIFHGTRTPLTVWFSAAWHLTSSKTGISAMQLQREMGLGSYQTAWTMLHRYRTVMVRPGRDRLSGNVEVDESFLGGPEPGVPGRGALSKVLFAAAVEVGEKGFGRARLGVLENANADTLRDFWSATSNPGRGSTPTAGDLTRRRPRISTCTLARRWRPPDWRHTRSFPPCTVCSRW